MSKKKLYLCSPMREDTRTNYAISPINNTLANNHDLIVWLLCE